jgi:hypothetical protein
MARAGQAAGKFGASGMKAVKAVKAVKTATCQWDILKCPACPAFCPINVPPEAGRTGHIP